MPEKTKALADMTMAELEVEAGKLADMHTEVMQARHAVAAAMDRRRAADRVAAMPQAERDALAAALGMG